MSNELDLEALRRLQYAIKSGAPLAGMGNAAIVQLPAILAALQRAERVEAAARAVLLDCEQDESGFVTLPSDSLADLEAALAAAPCQCEHPDAEARLDPGRKSCPVHGQTARPRSPADPASRGRTGEWLS